LITVVYSLWKLYPFVVDQFKPSPKTFRICFNLVTRKLHLKQMENRKEVVDQIIALALKDISEEQKTEILIPFLKIFYSSAVLDETELKENERLDDNDIIMICSSCIIDRISSGELNCEKVHNQIMVWIYATLKKITYIGERDWLLEEKNRLKYFSASEKEFTEMALDKISVLFNWCTELSTLTTEEKTNWDLDGIIYVKKFFACDPVSFENRINSSDKTFSF